MEEKFTKFEKIIFWILGITLAIFITLAGLRIYYILNVMPTKCQELARTNYNLNDMVCSFVNTECYCHLNLTNDCLEWYETDETKGCIEYKYTNEQIQELRKVYQIFEVKEQGWKLWKWV